jgi:hypothetical protein
MNPLETIQSGLNSWVHETKVHLAGKGITTGAVMIASVLSPVLPWIVPFMIALGGVATHMYFRLREQWKYQDEMALKYKDEIASQLGIDPEAVTREHVKLAAYGNEQQGIEDNPILAQALNHQHQKSWLVFGTALLAAVVTVGLLTFSGGIITDAIGSGLVSMFGLNAVPPALGFVSSVVGNLGGFVIAAGSSLFVQNGLELLIGNAKGINAPSAHDRILAIEARHARGKSVTPEQVFQVKLAASPELEERVVAMTGKHFHALKADIQERVLARIDTKKEMHTVAEEINKGNIDATELAFILTSQQPLHKTKVEKECDDSPVPVAEHKKTFAERLGLKPKEDGHAQRIDESRVVPIESARG